MTNTNEARISDSERRAASEVQDYLFAHGGDSTTDRSASPAGDGRWVKLTEIFPRNAAGNAARQAVRRLHRRGRLGAYEVAYHDDCVKAVAAEHVAAEEAKAASGAYGR